jgi:hypothetical protein
VTIGTNEQEADSAIVAICENNKHVEESTVSTRPLTTDSVSVTIGTTKARSIPAPLQQIDRVNVTIDHHRTVDSVNVTIGADQHTGTRPVDTGTTAGVFF